MSLILLEQAASASRGGDPKQALVTLTKLYEAATDPREKQRAQYEIAWCHRALGDLDVSADIYRQILKRATESVPEQQLRETVRPRARRARV